MGCGALVMMDDRGRVLIPKEVREKVGTRLFSVELRDDGSIVLKPVVNDVQRLAKKFSGLLKYGSFEELEERQEEYVRRERGL